MKKIIEYIKISQVELRTALNVCTYIWIQSMFNQLNINKSVVPNHQTQRKNAGNFILFDELLFPQNETKSNKKNSPTTKETEKYFRSDVEIYSQRTEFGF